MDELRYCIGRFGDERLKKGGLVVRADGAQRHRPGSSACLLAGGRGAHFALSGQRAGHGQGIDGVLRGGPLTAGRHVLAIQDTTELNYQHHCGRTCGLGTVGNGRDAGLFLHPVLALDAETGACLGLVGAKLWLRKTAKAPNYRDLRIEAKESFRWLEGAQMAKQALDLAAHVMVVADRESDIYEEWVRLPDRCFDLLTRACRDRAIVGGGSLFAFTDTLPLAGRFHLELPARPGKRAAREAKMELRFGSVTIKRPRHCSDRAAPETLTLRIVDVREATPPDNGDEA